MKLAQYSKCLVSTVNTDGLVLWHQAISGHSAEYAAVYGLTTAWLWKMICIA